MDLLRCFVVLSEFLSFSGGCKTLLFKIRYEGKALSGFVFKITDSQSEELCRVYCYMSSRCLSYNFMHNNHSTCELSESNHVMNHENLVPRTGSVYSEAETGCNCLKGEKCLFVTAANTFKCQTTASNSPKPSSTASTNSHSSPVPTATPPATDSTEPADSTPSLQTTCILPTSHVANQGGNCQLYFPRNSPQDYVQVENVLSKDITKFSISFWLKIPSSNDNEVAILSYGKSWLIFALKIHRDGTVEVYTNGYSRSLNSNLVRDDTWQFFTLVKTSSREYHFLKNGLMQSTTDSNFYGQKIFGGGTFYLGKTQKSTLQGSIANLFFWDENLLENQNDSIGQIIRDKCKHSYNGQLIFSWEDVLNSSLTGEVIKQCPCDI